MRAKTSSILSTIVNLDAEGTAVVKADSIIFWQVVFPSSYPRIRGKTVLRCPALVYAEVTLCDVNSKASLQSKMHRLPQPAYTSVSVYEQVQGDLLHSSSCQDDYHSRLAINIC